MPKILSPEVVNFMICLANTSVPFNMMFLGRDRACGADRIRGVAAGVNGRERKTGHRPRSHRQRDARGLGVA